MKRLILCAAILLSPTVCTAQTSECKLTVDDAPSVRGLKLRMAKKDVAALYPGIGIGGESAGRSIPVRQAAHGESSVDIHVAVYGIYDRHVGEKLKGIERVGLKFLDDKISYMQFDYDDSVKWASVGDFSRALNGALKLPAAWQLPRPYADEMVMQCQGFSVTASVVGSSATLTFSDTTAPSVIKRRIQEEEDKARDAFKP